jgi:hypothetical protein
LKWGPMNFLPRLVSHHDPCDLGLQSSSGYKKESLNS